MQKTFMQPLIFSNTVLCITSAQHPTVSYGLFFFFGYLIRKHGGTHRTKQQFIQHSSWTTEEKQFSSKGLCGWNKAFQLKRLSEQTITLNTIMHCSIFRSNLK